MEKNRYSVLIIDDEPNNIIALTEILEEDYTVYAVVDSMEAVETAEDVSPDVILLDVLMPDMDGYDVISVLKASEKTCDIPVIFITGLDSIEAEEKGLALGAMDYLSKPFHAAIVKTRVKNHIKLVQRLRQQTLMAEITHSFLSDEHIDSLLTDTLRTVGEFMDLAQLLLYKLEENGNRLICQNEWIKPGLNLETRVGSVLELKEPILSTISSLLKNKESDLCIHSNDPSFKEVMKPYRKNFDNYITTPVFVKGKLSAALDFSREDDGRDWDRSEISLAVLVSDVISGVFERDAMERQFYIVENSPYPILSVTQDAVVEYINPAVSKAFGYTKNELITEGLEIVFGIEMLKEIKEKHIPFALRGATARFEAQVIRRNGEKRTLAASIFKMGQNSLGLTIRDLTKIQKPEAESKKIYNDELTDMYNRRFFDENIDRIIKSLSRSKSCLSLLMIDIDFFKSYNDTYGIGAGDECLIKIADVLGNSLPRTDDFVARYSDEEFVIVLPNTDDSGARKVAERLLKNIRDCDIPHENNDAADFVTVSIGVVTGTVKFTHTPDDFIKKADKMLHKSQKSGRNMYSIESL